MEITTDIDLTTRELAEAFWALDNNQQADFFLHLYKAVRRDVEAGKTWLRDEYGAFQWGYLRDGVKNLPKEDQLNAANMVRAVAAEFYKYTLGDEWDWERMDYEVTR